MALLNVLNIDAIIDRFPKKPTKINGTPTFQTLNKLKLNLQVNVSLVPSNLGGAQNGYLGLILAPPAYATLRHGRVRGPATVHSTFPETVPTINSVNDMAREAELRKFEAGTYAWREYDNMCKALCKHIITAVDNVYIKAKRTRASGYNKVTVNQLLVHLFTQYGDINPNNITNNNKCFSKPWDGAEPFENVSKHFDNSIEFAQAVLSPYLDTQILDRATLAIYNTGLFYEDLKK
jgi:hypothetical protein